MDKSRAGDFSFLVFKARKVITYVFILVSRPFGLLDHGKELFPTYNKLYHHMMVMQFI
ncbi:hypothetical protein BANRA_05722 [Klebsiella pneumoniae]|nr:hypothetical protein BANRA_05722 [Klebsiella pneumoniae]